MAGIITDVKSDIEKLKDLKAAIEEVKKAIKDIDVNINIHIAKELEPKLKSLTAQYDKLAFKILKTEATIGNSVKNIVTASDKIIQAQEKLSKVAKIPMQTGNTSPQAVNIGETAIIQAQAKAYEELSKEINNILGTREANVKRMVDEMNAIRLINAEIKKITKSQGEYSTLSSAQQARLEQLNSSLLTHKTALSEVRQTLSNNVKLDNAAATSMNGLSQSLSRMKIAYRELTEEERNSPIGKELLASINQADAKIKELDATIGNHQRNVGNYSKQWDGLGMSIQQVGRELPSLAYGPKVFFSAISNNLPILVDEIKRAKDAYNSLVSQGEKATPVWKQIASSLFSWQTALTVGITLLTVYGDKLVDWVVELLQGKKALSEIYQVSEDFNKSVSEISSNPIATLEKLSTGWKKLGGDIKAQEKYILENKSAFDSTGTAINSIKDAENLLINNKAAFIESIIAKAKATATMKLAAEEYERYLQKMREAETMPEEKTYYVQNGMFGGMTSYTGKNQQKIAAQKEAKKFRTSFDSLIEDVIKYEKEATNKVNEAGVNLTNSLIDGSVAAIKATISKKQKELEQAIDSTEYKRIEAEIKAEQAKLAAITGSEFDKEANKRLKLQTDLSRSILEADLKLQESRLSIMEDGRKKRMEQSDLEHKQQKAAIEKEYQDTVQKYKDLKQAVPETVETTYKARLQANDEAKKTRDTKIDEDYVKERKEHEEALTAYLLSEEDKRKKSIKERYDSEREWAKKQFKGENMTKEEYEAYSAKIDTAEAEDSLNELLEKYQTYTDKRAKIEQTFAKQKEELEKSGASKETLDEVDYQQQETLKAIDEQFASRQEEYQGWCNQIANMTLEKLQAVLKETKAELDKMESSGMSGNELAAQRAKVNKLEEQIKNEKITTTPESRSIKQWQKLRSTLSEVKDEFEEIGESVGGVAGEFISAAGEIASSTLQMIDGIVMLSNNSATAMKKTSEAGVEAMSTVEKASVILAVTSAALQIATKIAGLFSKEDSHKKKRDNMLEEAEVMREVWDDILERQKEYLSNSTGTDAKKSYEESLNILKQQEEVSRKIAQETLKIKNHSHSMDYRMWSGSYKYDGQNWRDVTGEIKELTGISVNGMQDIANMSADNLRLLRDNFIGLWSNMDETFRKQLEEIIELDDEAKKLGKDYKEALSQITFDNVKDDFLDLLSDMDTGSKDFADNFEEYMRKAILNSMVYDNYRKELEKWYEKFSLANAKDGGITPDDYEDLKQEYNSITEAALAERERLKGMFNWNEGESSRTSEAQGIASMSQDSANELNGNFNALLIYSSKTSESVARVKEDLAYIREIQMSGWKDVKAIKELTTEVRNHTKKLTELSEKIEKHTGSMADELVDIKHSGLYIKK
ncbi:coiled-coil domain-containing protein [Parabacteroides pacaensis]|uniref:hypothetical protein n=1 Tax=Parabacteroides pacaensis TaxID=2086575 RepID=UPI000D106ABC|nr:hypothetical protein [Parabacteroides pacaensis]